MSKPCLAVILAAGKGTRMGGRLAKLLHPIGNLAMIDHVLGAAQAFADRIAVVIGPDQDDLAARVGRSAPGAEIAIQNERRGTAHALLQMRDCLRQAQGPVVVMYGDTPFVSQKSFMAMLAALREGADVAVLGFKARDPHGYGRLIMDNGQLCAIVEEASATAVQREIDFCNSGVIGFNGAYLPQLPDRIGNNNSREEYYITDAVALAHEDGMRVEAITGSEEEFLGINTPFELAQAEEIFQARKRRAMLDGGVIMTAPQTVFFSWDTTIEAGAVIDPYVVFGEGVSIGANVHIRAFSHLQGTHLDEGAQVGPFSRLRPHTHIGEGARVGNFVEVKNTRIAADAKANHLAYIGDTQIDKAANIGAGTITCNYDGIGKYQTIIGANAFVGSNSTLVAPVSIGAGAYIASGSVVTTSVERDALAIARARQVDKPGRASRLRARLKARKHGDKS